MTRTKQSDTSRIKVAGTHLHEYEGAYDVQQVNNGTQTLKAERGGEGGEKKEEERDETTGSKMKSKRESSSRTKKKRTETRAMKLDSLKTQQRASLS